MTKLRKAPLALILDMNMNMNSPLERVGVINGYLGKIVAVGGLQEDVQVVRPFLRGQELCVFFVSSSCVLDSLCGIHTF